jgi:hypothetical protein
MRTVPPLVLVALCLTSCAAKADSVPNPATKTELPAQRTPADDLQHFWGDFRAAVLANDAQKVAALTRFPFKTRGTLDADPVETHDRAWFLDALDRLLAQDPGLSMQPDTMRALIERTRALSAESAGGRSAARLGDFVFEKTGEKWLFTLAYTAE